MVTMQAIEVTETGGPEVLRNVEKPTPSPGSGEVLIKAEAIGVNFVDTYFRSGAYPHKLPFVLGAEVGGTVEALGDGVTALRVGDRVATADAVGAYAEYCIAAADDVASVPDGVATDIAAAAILKGMTAHLLINSVYPVQEGDTVLLHAGAGGVGLILTQWATSLGARVITTTSTAHKAQLSRQAGAVDVLDYPDDPQQFGASIRQLTGGTALPPSTTAWANPPSTPALPAWQSGALSCCSARPVGRCRLWTRSDSTPRARCTSPARRDCISSAPATSSPGAQTNCSTRLPPAPSRST
jgi:NADPH:quinone reductase